MTSDPLCTFPGVPTGPARPEHEPTGFYPCYLFITQPFGGCCASHLTVAEVLKEVGKVLNDAGVFGTVSVRVTDEDFGPGPRPLRVESCAVIGRVTALLVQLAVNVF